MVTKLYKRKCCVCNARGDGTKKKSFQLAHPLIIQHYKVKISRDEKGVINDLICRKHLRTDNITLQKLQNKSDNNGAANQINQVNVSNSLNENTPISNENESNNMIQDFINSIIDENGQIDDDSNENIPDNNLINEENNSIDVDNDEENKENHVPVRNEEKLNDSIILNIDRAASCDSKCFVCSKKITKNVKYAEINCKNLVNIYGRCSIYVNHGSKCCQAHLDGEFLTDESINQIKVEKERSSFTHVDLENFFKGLSKRR